MYFQQLLKQTELEHPDYYHLESSLQRLGSFLADLNDSIEYSMKVVAADTTPKPKRYENQIVCLLYDTSSVIHYYSLYIVCICHVITFCTFATRG